jgi:hypothetical protein
VKKQSSSDVPHIYVLNQAKPQCSLPPKRVCSECCIHRAQNVAGVILAGLHATFDAERSKVSRSNKVWTLHLDEVVDVDMDENIKPEEPLGQAGMPAEDSPQGGKEGGGVTEALDVKLQFGNAEGGEAGEQSVGEGNGSTDAPEAGSRSGDAEGEQSGEKLGAAAGEEEEGVREVALGESSLEENLAEDLGKADTFELPGGKSS